MKCSNCGGARFNGSTCSYCGHEVTVASSQTEAADRRRGFLRLASTLEIRVPLPDKERMEYSISSDHHRLVIARENTTKLLLVDRILSTHKKAPTLIIGEYHEAIQDHLGLPMVLPDTPQELREKLLSMFSAGQITTLFMSNSFSAFPDAEVYIQLSGIFNSYTADEAYRTGRLTKNRVLRKEFVYVLNSMDTVEHDSSRARQELVGSRLGFPFNQVRLTIPYGTKASEVANLSEWRTELIQAMVAFQSSVKSMVGKQLEPR